MDRSYSPSENLTIVICTHNRSSILSLLIAELRHQVTSNVECIIVDSASRKEEAEIVRATVASLPGARLIRLETAGISLARNAGLREVRSPWAVILDDDELVGPTWLLEMSALVRRLPDNCAICGGNVIPIIHHADSRIGPRWRKYLSEFSNTGEYDQTDNLQLGLGHSVIRMEAFRDVGEFDEMLGRNSATLLSGEDVYFAQQVAAAGWRIWHSDRISVGHIIEPIRLTRAWVRRRAYWEGVTSAKLLRRTNRRALHRQAIAISVKIIPLFAATAVMPADKEYDLRTAFGVGYLADCLISAGKRYGLGRYITVSGE